MLQLHLSYQLFYCLLRCDLYERFYGRSTRTPVFWEYLLPPHDYLYYQFILDPFHSKSKLCFAGGYDYKFINLTKLGTYVKGYTNYYICIKFENSNWEIWPCFLSLAQSKAQAVLGQSQGRLLQCLACDWWSIAWAYSENETENGPWSLLHS